MSTFLSIFNDLLSLNSVEYHLTSNFFTFIDSATYYVASIVVTTLRSLLTSLFGDWLVLFTVLDFFKTWPVIIVCSILLPIFYFKGFIDFYKTINYSSNFLSPINNIKFPSSFNIPYFKKTYTNLMFLNFTPTTTNSNTTNNTFSDSNIKLFVVNYIDKPIKMNIFNENWVSLFWWNSLTLKSLFFNNSKFFYSGWYSRVYILLLNAYKRTVGDGLLYIRGLFLIFFIDACLTDDEPIWEPVEWSLIQTWLLFLFIFSWIAENLITSRYGSYTGRDKRVWYAWYRSFWGIEFFFFMSLGAAAMFVIVPFYFEVTYNVSLVFSWWDWFSRIFFFKFISIFTIMLSLAYVFLMGIRWLNWKKQIILVMIINFFLIYLLYSQFIVSFLSYFTDPIWYQKNRTVDYIQLSHGPLKWGFGPAKRDHFSYHNVSTVFWFKNDSPFAEAMLLLNLMLFLSTFSLYMYWLVLLRRIYATEEVSYTYSTYVVSSLKQFFYFFLYFYLFIFISWLLGYWRFPIEYYWLINGNNWLLTCWEVVIDYYDLIKQLF